MKNSGWNRWRFKLKREECRLKGELLREAVIYWDLMGDNERDLLGLAELYGACNQRLVDLDDGGDPLIAWNNFIDIAHGIALKDDAKRNRYR